MKTFYKMPNNKVKEKKQSYGYRAKPSIQKKAVKKAKSEKTTLSLKIENFLYEYSSL